MKLYLVVGESTILSQSPSTTTIGRNWMVVGLFLNEVSANACPLPAGFPSRKVVEIESDFSVVPVRQGGTHLDMLTRNNQVGRSELTEFPFRVGDIVSHIEKTSDQRFKTILALTPCSDYSQFANLHMRHCPNCVWKTLIKIDGVGFEGTHCWCVWNGEQVCWVKEGIGSQVSNRKRLLRPIEVENA